jgi:hypothetical protein
MYADTRKRADRFRLIQDTLNSVIPNPNWANIGNGCDAFKNSVWKYMKTFKRRLDTDENKESLIKEIIGCVMKIKNKLASTEGVGRFHPAALVQMYFDGESNKMYNTPTFQI